MTPILGITASAIVPPAAGSFESIASATGTGSSGTITFSSIPGTYQHLQIRCLMRCTDATSNKRDLRIQFNSDTGTNYASHYLRGFSDGTVQSGAQITNFTYNNVLTSVVANNGLASTMGVAIIDIHDYTSTTKNKVLRSFSGANENDNSTDYVTLTSGLWLNTSAITSISLIASGGNWTTTSTFALYGIKG